ncbi:MAG: peptidoglycan bridge formation glycyltransferase FemA/FemB family protein [Parcubacteria group bacterium]|jgi:lipid II:glycine glycyltransferase (peptidoglycan interpeptide bridge formation enzyme)
MLNNNRDEFIQRNSPYGGFLQSNQWMNFQNKFGIKNYNISDKKFWSNILEHQLPLIGKYFYVPRGPISDKDIKEEELGRVMEDLMNLAKIKKVAWVRIDNFDKKIKNSLKNKKYEIAKAPHDMQPKQIFVIDINKNEEDILSEMKPKTRYNIKLANKKGVQIEILNGLRPDDKKVEDFLNLIEKTGNRKNISFHPKIYYREMLGAISGDNLKLCLATYRGVVIAGALLVIYGETATYLHGASDDENKNVMAPFLLQWEMIKEAKKRGALRYDFGGVSIGEENKERELKWAGVTRFKRGFSQNNQPVEFSGSYDIIINPIKYWSYRLIQKIKRVL